MQLWRAAGWVGAGREPPCCRMEIAWAGPQALLSQARGPATTPNGTHRAQVDALSSGVGHNLGGIAHLRRQGCRGAGV